MSKKVYEESNIQNIADAIREKNGTQNQYTVAQMPAAVRDIQTQPDLETLAVTENGNYLPSAGKDGFSSVSVNVESGEAIIQPLSVAQNGTYNPPSGVDGYAPITVNVSGGAEINEYQINWNTSIVNDSKGTIVYDGHFATLTAWVEFSSATSSKRKIGQVPSEICPCGVYPFTAGNGGTTAIGTGYIDTDGSIYLEFNSNYAYFTLQWLVPKTILPITRYNTSVFTSERGQIAIVEDLAEFAGYFSLASFSSGWKVNCFTLPQEIVSDIRPVCRYDGTSVYFADTTYAGNGNYNIFLMNSRGPSIYVKATWKIPKTI